MKYFLLLISLSILTSCGTVAPSGSLLSDLPASPVEPSWVQYTRAPIVSETTSEEGNNNFVVSDEFVKKSIQERNYIKKVKTWKEINSVP